MKASRTPPTVGCWRLKATIFSRSSGRIQCPLGTTPSGRGFFALQGDPAVIGSSREIQNGKRLSDGEFGPFLQMCHGLYDLFRRRRLTVGPGERSPVLFFNIRFSMESSETTDSSFRIRLSFSRISRCRTFLCWCIPPEKVWSSPSGACLPHPRISCGVLPVSSARSPDPQGLSETGKQSGPFLPRSSVFSSRFPGGRDFPCALSFPGRGDCVKVYQRKCHFILNGTKGQ